MQILFLCRRLIERYFLHFFFFTPLHRVERPMISYVVLYSYCDDLDLPPPFRYQEFRVFLLGDGPPPLPVMTTCLFSEIVFERGSPFSFHTEAACQPPLPKNPLHIHAAAPSPISRRAPQDPRRVSPLGVQISLSNGPR